MEEIIDTPQITPMGLTRQVAHADGNNARRVTLPATWVRYSATPTEVFLVVGNLIILSSVENKDQALKAAECLYENGLMEGLPEPAVMEEISE